MDLTKKLNFFVFLLFTPVILFGATDFEFTSDKDCSEKRLDRVPEMCSKIPVQDQDGTGLCSAYTTTQLVDCWRAANDQPVTDFTSPIPLGVQYAAKAGKDQINGNPVFDMIDYARNLDSCSYSVVRDEFNSKKSADFIYELVKNFQNAKTNPSSKDASADSIMKCVLGSGTNKTFSIEQIKNYMDEKHWVNFTSKIMDDLCKGHKKPLAFLPTAVKLKSNEIGDHFKSMNTFRSLINGRLDKKNAQPVGISYCRTVLKDKDAEGVSLRGALNKDTCKGEVHASVIMGRRLLKYKDGDKTQTICQYLVRDSYGSSCNGYAEHEAEAIPSTPGGEKPKICERGQVWVDENALLRNTAEVFHLKDK